MKSGAVPATLRSAMPSVVYGAMALGQIGAIDPIDRCHGHVQWWWSVEVAEVNIGLDGVFVNKKAIDDDLSFGTVAFRPTVHSFIFRVHPVTTIEPQLLTR